MRKKKSKKKNGRPFKITPLIVSKLEEAASLDASICEMCTHADISRPTYYAEIKRNKKLFDRLEALREKPALNCRIAIDKRIKDGDGDLALKYLERKRKKEFAPMTKSELTGANGAPLPINTVQIYIPHNNRDPLPDKPKEK